MPLSSAVGKSVEETLTLAQSEDNKTLLRRQTEQAKSLGIFGSPTFVVAGDLFWGDDRLEDALDYAIPGTVSRSAPGPSYPKRRPKPLG